MLMGIPKINTRKKFKNNATCEDNLKELAANFEDHFAGTRTVPSGAAPGGAPRLAPEVGVASRGSLGLVVRGPGRWRGAVSRVLRFQVSDST